MIEAPKRTLICTGYDLTIGDVMAVARGHVDVALTDDPMTLGRIAASCGFIRAATAEGEPVYGVTTGFGGMAHQVIPREQAAAFQNNAMWTFKAGTGAYLPVPMVRAAMLLRANSHLHGISGVRLELIRRLIRFLNAGVTPHVPELGSIGASGDVVPLTYIVGAAIGHDDAFTVDDNGATVGCRAALRRLGLAPLPLEPKEGLAMFNGTSVSTGVAIACLADANDLFALAMGAHALYLQAFAASNQSFHPFIHRHKPHAGQIWAAETMLALLDGSRMIRDELDGQHDHRGDDLIQDRYSLRCLPQFIGPIHDWLRAIAADFEAEANSANDNPLIDPDRWQSYHGGNFLGQYVSVGLDHLRSFLGLLAKHLDVQIAFLSSAEFSGGLAPCLIGNTGSAINLGLKGLQLCGNAIMPLITYLGAPIADRFPTHAEQFNQNVNSQSYGAAYLARQSVALLRQYTAIALLFGVQAADLRAALVSGRYDARTALSAATIPLYEAVRSVIASPIRDDRPYIWDDNEQFLDAHIAALVADIAAQGNVLRALPEDLRNLTAPAIQPSEGAAR